jgi:hypothetical protein
MNEEKVLQAIEELGQTINSRIDTLEIELVKRINDLEKQITESNHDNQNEYDGKKLEFLKHKTRELEKQVFELEQRVLYK